MAERDSDLVMFRTCGDNAEASALRALLHAHGIACVVQGEQHRALLGTLGGYIEVNVLVPRGALEAAHAVVEEAEADAGPALMLVDAEDEAVAASRRRRRRIIGWAVLGLLFGPGVLGLLARLLGAEPA